MRTRSEYRRFRIRKEVGVVACCCRGSKRGENICLAIVVFVYQYVNAGLSTTIILVQCNTFRYMQRSVLALLINLQKQEIRDDLALDYFLSFHPASSHILPLTDIQSIIDLPVLPPLFPPHYYYFYPICSPAHYLNLKF